MWRSSYQNFSSGKNEFLIQLKITLKQLCDNVTTLASRKKFLVLVINKRLQSLHIPIILNEDLEGLIEVSKRSLNRVINIWKVSKLYKHM